MTSRDQWIPGEIGRTWSGHRLVIDVALADPVEVLRAQRARFTQRLRRLPTHAWGAPTRCELWDVADVVAHRADGNRRARANLARAQDPPSSPPTGPGALNPRTTFHESVLAARGHPRADLVEDFESGTAQTSAALRAAITADIPPAVHFLGTYRPVGRALHMLWDSVIHERDVSLPLGIGGDHTDDELAAVGAYALLYAAASLAPFDPSVSVEVHLTDRTTHRYHLVLTDAMVKLTTSQRDAVGEAPWIRGSTLATIDAFAGRGTLDIVEFSTDTVRQRFAAAPAAGALQPL